MTIHHRFIASLLVFALALQVGLSGFSPQSARAASNPTRPGLRDLAQAHGIYLGVTDSGYWSRDHYYEDTVPHEFNSLTSEYLAKFQFIHPCPPPWLIESNPSVAAWVAERGAGNLDEKRHCSLSNAQEDEWEWSDVDETVKWAQDHRMGFRFHTLLWHALNPEWLDTPGVVLSLVERQRLMEEHIRVVVSHYCRFDNLYQFDVVNEAIMPNGQLYPVGPWYDIPDFIDQAFRITRQELDRCGRPDVKLYYNDFEIEYGRVKHYRGSALAPEGDFNKTESVLSYLASLLKRPDPTPIDGIGLQTHLWMSPSYPFPHDTSRMVETMNRFTAELGLEVMVTELDIAIDQTDDPAAFYKEQAEQFGGVVEACLLAIRCEGVVTWGTHDGASWLEYMTGQNKRPLIYDDARDRVYDSTSGQCVSTLSTTGIEDRSVFEYCPKPAFEAIFSTLSRPLVKMYFPKVIN